MNKPIMNEEGVDYIIKSLASGLQNFGGNTGNKFCEPETYSGIATALAQWTRIKNDVRTGRIDKSVIEPYPTETTEPEDDDAEKPF